MQIWVCAKFLIYINAYLQNIRYEEFQNEEGGVNGRYHPHHRRHYHHHHRHHQPSSIFSGTVDCRNLGLTSVPKELPPDTKEL